MARSNEREIEGTGRPGGVDVGNAAMGVDDPVSEGIVTGGSEPDKITAFIGDSTEIADPRQNQFSVEGEHRGRMGRDSHPERHMSSTT